MSSTRTPSAICMPRTCWKAGTDLRTIQLLLGHTHLEDTTIYLHLSQTHAARKADPIPG